MASYRSSLASKGMPWLIPRPAPPPRRGDVERGHALPRRVPVEHGFELRLGDAAGPCAGHARVAVADADVPLERDVVAAESEPVHLAQRPGADARRGLDPAAVEAVVDDVAGDAGKRPGLLDAEAGLLERGLVGERLGPRGGIGAAVVAGAVPAGELPRDVARLLGVDQLVHHRPGQRLERIRRA